MPVKIVNWNPKRIPQLDRYPIPFPRKNNFGDLIGPVLASRLTRDVHGYTTRSSRLLTVGSILHLAQDGDVVWGSGVNGKVPRSTYKFSYLDVRAVRGPRTRDYLLALGIESPEVYGDPALLLPSVCPDLFEGVDHKTRALTVVPNLNDLRTFARHPHFVDPRTPLPLMMDILSRSEVIVGSSLHAFIIAEALGIPTALFSSPHEPPFKYLDYAAGTGRSEIPIFGSLDSAKRNAKRGEFEWDPQPLLNSFPHDIYRD